MKCKPCFKSNGKVVKLKIIATSKESGKLKAGALVTKDSRYVCERKYRCPACHTLTFTQEFVSSIRKRSALEFKREMKMYMPRKFAGAK